MPNSGLIPAAYRVVRMLAPVTIVGILAVAGRVEAADAVATPFAGLRLGSAGVTVLPESERSRRRVVIGIDANQTKYFMLPSTEGFDPRSMDPRVRFVRRQSYWLNFELEHGRLLDAFPEYTRFFVALPDARVSPGSLGNEEEVFRDYLQRRLGWSADKVRSRVRFFKVPEPLLYPRDMGEVVGHDDADRLVLGVGGDADGFYAEPVHRLAAAFPADFRVLPLGTKANRGGVGIEGGDVSVVWLPEGRPGVLIGRHRVLRFLDTLEGVPHAGRRLARAQVEAARTAFREAFFGLEVVIAGEAGLLDPGLVTDELFHLDMVVNVVRTGMVVTAFVPSFEGAAVDATSGLPIAEEVRRRVQREYDLVAAQLARRGYRVARLPLADHPVRNPVNVGRFVDRRNGRQTVLLGRYPYHLPAASGERPAQAALQDSLTRLEEAVLGWRADPDGENWTAVEAAFGAVWQAMDRAAAAPNPIFDAQRRVYESLGVTVVPVPMFPTGEGGLHCLVLQ
ncbi:MAG: hypothetical protein HY825_17940 [Acidobacteria bacterium]|nr:hypothetical protein [Acidobacteriota bacterium]